MKIRDLNDPKFLKFIKEESIVIAGKCRSLIETNSQHRISSFFDHIPPKVSFNRRSEDVGTFKYQNSSIDEQVHK